MADVLIGSVIGGVFGLLAWPRGAHDELGRATAGLLRRAAEIVVATSASVAAGGTGEGAVAARGYRSLRHALTMAESAYAQFQSEPVRFGAATPRPPGPDWQAALMTGHHVLWGADRLTAPPDRPAPPDGLGTGPAGPAPLGPEAAEGLTGIGDRVAGRMLLVSAHLDPGGDTP
ncbi:hypothetical protein EDD96_7359, partial [Streptomyces sp. Ag109_G2-6]